MTPKYRLAILDDDELLEALKKLAISDLELTAELVAHIAEVDARRLYLEEACSSMYTYARDVLGMDEGAAYKRIHAARAARKYPRIFEMLAGGELHLSGVTLLAPVLTVENHDTLLALATGKSKREIERLVAERFPSPDVPSIIRKLPAPRASLEHESVAMGDRAPASPAASRAQDDSPPDGLPPGIAPPPASVPVSLPSPKTPFPKTHPLVKPLSAERYKVQFTASRECHDKLCEAQDLLRHQIPSGDIAAVIEKALKVLVEDVKHRRFGIPRGRRGQRKRPSGSTVEDDSDARHGRVDPGESSRQPGVATQGDASVAVQGQTPNDEAASTPGWTAEGGANTQGREGAGDRKNRSRYIATHVRRQVVERDGWRCSFMNAHGRRCTETGALEFHHVEAFAKGGEHTIDGIKLFCRAHNSHEAVKDFGAVFIESRKTRARSRRTSTTRAAPSSAQRAFPGESQYALFLVDKDPP